MNYYSLTAMFLGLAAQGSDVPATHTRILNAPAAEQRWMKRSTARAIDLSAEVDLNFTGDKRVCELNFDRSNQSACSFAQNCFFLKNSHKFFDRCSSSCTSLITGQWPTNQCDSVQFQYYNTDGREQVCGFIPTGNQGCVDVTSQPEPDHLAIQKAAVRHLAASVANVESACAGTDLGDSLDAYRSAIINEEYCDDDCKLKFDTSDIYFKMIHDNENQGPYACSMEFNVNLQDRLDYWMHNMADRYPETRVHWQIFVTEQFTQPWNFLSMDFRHWQELDINAKEFWEAADALPGDSFSGAHDFWTEGQRPYYRAFFRQMFDSFAHLDPEEQQQVADAAGFMWNQILHNDYDWLAVLADHASEVGSLAASAMSGDDPVALNFIFRLSKLLDRISDFSFLPDPKPQVAQLSELFAFSSNGWDDYQLGDHTGQSFDDKYTLACALALREGPRAIEFLAQSGVV